MHRADRMTDHIPLKLTVALEQPVKWYPDPPPYDRHAMTTALTTTRLTGVPTPDYLKYCERVTAHCKQNGLALATNIVYEELEDCMNAAATEVFPYKKTANA